MLGKLWAIITFIAQAYQRHVTYNATGVFAQKHIAIQSIQPKHLQYIENDLTEFGLN
jgi:UDP-N-acetylglucosamine enolpyruvyl transferase